MDPKTFCCSTKIVILRSPVGNFSINAKFCTWLTFYPMSFPLSYKWNMNKCRKDVKYHTQLNSFGSFIRRKLSRLVTRFVTRLTRQVPLVEQELPTLPEHLSSPRSYLWGSCYSIFSFICMFCRLLFVLLYFFFGHCVVCSPSIYGFWLPPLISSNSSFNKNKLWTALLLHLVAPTYFILSDIPTGKPITMVAPNQLNWEILFIHPYSK